MRLGVTTTTGDAEGEVVETRPVGCSVGEVVEVLDRFMGPITQVPPMHSALKKDGKALYEYARDGETVILLGRTLSKVEAVAQDVDGGQVERRQLGGRRARRWLFGPPCILGAIPTRGVLARRLARGFSTLRSCRCLGHQPCLRWKSFMKAASACTPSSGMAL